MQLRGKREAAWLDLPQGVRVKVRPLTSALYATARAKAFRAVRDLAEHVDSVTAAGGRIEDLPDLSDPAAQTGVSEVMFAEGLGIAAIVEWENVTGPDGAPAPVTPANVVDLMNEVGFPDAFLSRYVRSHEKRLAEGNVSGPAPSGTSAPGPTTAEAAPGKDNPAPTASQA